VKYLIYRALSPTNKSYIGYTSKSLQERIYFHLDQANNKNRPEYYRPFKKALRKYKDKIVWTVLDITNTIENAHNLEKHYIEIYKSYKNGYNASLGGEGVNRRSTEDIINSAKKHKSVKSWIEEDPSARVLATNIGKNFYNKCTEHMEKHLILTKDVILENARQFKTKGEWSKSKNNKYLAAKRRGSEFFNECVKHMDTSDKRGRPNV